MSTMQNASAAKPLHPNMSAFDLARLNLNDTLYVRSLRTPKGDAFEVHAADGTLLFVVEDLHDVVETARANDMRLATVH